MKGHEVGMQRHVVGLRPGAAVSSSKPTQQETLPAERKPQRTAAQDRPNLAPPERRRHRADSPELPSRRNRKSSAIARV
eukprot:1062683-Heterocapsa_arctica.AAC.1